LCERGQAISVTLRSIEKASGKGDVETDPEKVDLAKVKESKFKPNPDGEGNWFSLHQQCQALTELIFEPDNRHPHGLVVICGSTNSAKSLIARGLIHNLLVQRTVEYQERITDYTSAVEAYYWRAAVYALTAPWNTFNEKAPEWQARRTHLVTFEDPIEKLLFKTDGTRGKLATQVAREYGVDYTPREKGTDVGSLKEGFRDALRQTPFAYYVGEVRDGEQWREVLEFAGTGHLVVTTAHAGSLLEMMMKILSSVQATTAARRRLAAEKILALVHMRSFGQFPAAPRATAPGPAPAAPAPLGLLLPSVWRNREKGLAALTATGFSSIVPLESVTDEVGIRRDESCFGYHAMFQYLAHLAHLDPATRLDTDTRRALALVARTPDL
jgi:hypothetical protein